MSLQKVYLFLLWFQFLLPSEHLELPTSCSHVTYKDTIYNIVERLRQTYKTGTLIATIMILTGTSLLLCFPNAIISLFSASKNMCSLNIPAMRIMSLDFVFRGLSTMIATYEQATDKVLPSMMIQLLRQGILLIPFMWMFNYIFKINGIWISFPVTELIVFISLFLATKKRAAKLDLR